MKRTHGLTQRSDRKLYDMWKVRVWRYLAFCVDGNLRGLTNATISIRCGTEDRDGWTGTQSRAEKVEHNFELLTTFVSRVHPTLGTVYGCLRSCRSDGWVRVQRNRSGEATQGRIFQSFRVCREGGQKQVSWFSFDFFMTCETIRRMVVTREVQAALCWTSLSPVRTRKPFRRSRSSARAADEVAALIVLPEVVKLCENTKMMWSRHISWLRWWIWRTVTTTRRRKWWDMTFPWLRINVWNHTILISLDSPVCFC